MHYLKFQTFIQNIKYFSKILINSENKTIIKAYFKQQLELVHS